MPRPWEVASTAEIVEASSPVGWAMLESLINDGDDDIIFGIDASTTSSSARTVKAGEQYVGTDMGIQCRVLYYRSVSGSQPFRAWGLK